MIGYSLYFLLAVGLSMLITVAFRRLRQDEGGVARPEEDAAFDRRMAEIEARYGLGGGDRRGADRRGGSGQRKDGAPFE